MKWATLFARSFDMQLYDMHTHILPAFDDGAKTVEDSISLIENLKNQGVNNICLTPHFYTNERSLDRFLEKREKAFNRLKPYIPDDVNVVLGTEIYVTSYLFNNDDLSQITYGKSNYILTEFPYEMEFNEKDMQWVYILIQNHGLIPVLPHVERYEYLMNHIDRIRDLKELGMVIQTNISRYTNKASFFNKRKLMKMIDGGLIDILGSDTHSFTHNTPEVFTEACDNIAAKCGTHKLRTMMHNSKKIFNAAAGIEEY